MRHAVCALALATAAGAATAGNFSANLGAVSEFMFRGIAQSFGPAVQGGLDYAPETGFYAGAWASNTDYPGSRDQTVRYETDLYGGYVAEFGAVRSDLGLIHYRFPDDAALDTVELTASAGLGGVSLFVAHTRAFFGSEEPATYWSATLERAVGEQMLASAAGGYSSGRGADAVVGRAYWDYTLSLATEADALGPGRWRLALQGSDLDHQAVPGSEGRLVLDYLLEFER